MKAPKVYKAVTFTAAATEHGMQEGETKSLPVPLALEAISNGWAVDADGSAEAVKPTVNEPKQPIAEKPKGGRGKKK